MKALIRNKNETITESMEIEGIDWKTGAPLTNEEWCGGPYILKEITEEQLQVLLGSYTEE